MISWRDILSGGFFAYLLGGVRGIRIAVDIFVFAYALVGVAAILWISFALTEHGWLGWTEIAVVASLVFIRLISGASRSALERKRQAMVRSTLDKLSKVWPDFNQPVSELGVLRAISGQIVHIDEHNRKWVSLGEGVCGYITYGAQNKTYQKDMIVDVVYGGIDDRGYAILRDADEIAPAYVIRR